MEEHVVRANRFELVDASGEERAMLGLTPEGDPILNFVDGTGATRIIVSAANGDNAVISLNDDQGNERIGLSSGPDGQVVNVKDQSGRPRLQLQVTNDGGSDILLPDENGNHRLIVSQMADREGAPVLMLRDAAGNDRIQVQVGPGSISSLGFNNEDRRLQIALGQDDAGESIFSYEDEEGNMRRLF